MPDEYQVGIIDISQGCRRLQCQTGIDLHGAAAFRNGDQRELSRALALFEAVNGVGGIEHFHGYGDTRRQRLRQ